VSAVYLASVMDYVISEVLDLSGSVTLRQGRKIIKPNDINVALKCDKELNQFTRDVILPGVTNFINLK
jgi:histone H3/H4